jgi:cytochrome c6
MKMKKCVVPALVLAAIGVWIAMATTAQAATGKELFRLNCSACHANGGNIINAQKALRKADREANKVNTVEAIVGKMRNPGPGMSKFDSNFMPDSDAKAIAEYILKSF